MSKKIHVNPILKKELVVGSRSMKMAWVIMGLNAFLAIIVLLVLSITNLSANMNGYDYSRLMWLFPILGGTECAMLSLIIPIITSGSISGERERQTLDIMLTTPISPFSIAVGKLGSAMVVVMMYLISSIPIMAIAFVLGGMSWWALLGLFGMYIYLGIYVGSVGIFCSSVVKKSVAATILTIAIGIGIIVVTAVLFYVVVAMQSAVETAHGNIYNGPGAFSFIMMLNPYSPVFDFMLRVMTGNGIGRILKEAGTKSSLILSIANHWILWSVVLNMLISLGFLKLASKKIAATKNHK